MSGCSACLGTGWQLQMKSWFPRDGYSRSRCGVCEGYGFSNYDARECSAVQLRLHGLFNVPIIAKERG